MAINPARQETRLAKTREIAGKIKHLDEKIRSLLDDQDQRQVQVTLLENQIEETRRGFTPTDADAPPSQENAKVQAEMNTLIEQKAQIVTQYGQTSTTLKGLADEMQKLREQYPYIEVREQAQAAALDRKVAEYPSLLKRHLRKCRRFGWADPRLAGARKS